MTFVAEELRTFSIETFNFENLLNFNNVTLWPLWRRAAFGDFRKKNS